MHMRIIQKKAQEKQSLLAIPLSIDKILQELLSWFVPATNAAYLEDWLIFTFRENISNNRFREIFQGVRIFVKLIT